MSVVGFDIGNANCYIAVARAGGIETVANEYSDRCTPAIIGFTNKNRVVGISAKNQRTTNIKSTVVQFKRLIGRKYDEQFVQNELKNHVSKISRTDDGRIGVHVHYRGEEKVFTPEQLMGMLLSELKGTAEANLQKTVTDCVISVPAFYTDFQRRALLQAAQIAGLNCLKLMNETTAIALNYGLFKQDLPALDQKPRYVAFVDMGHSALQASIAAFNKGKIQILATASDPNLGGRDFDERLKNYFADEFATKYKLNVRGNPRAWTRLGTEVEKVKKQMSTNSTKLPMNIECFMEDVDVSSHIDRETFQDVSKDLIARLAIPLQEVLKESGISETDIDFVELVGGSTRIPALKATVEAIFKKPPSSTLNIDEAVARGCSIQCAMLSHTVRVRDIEVSDAATYPVCIAWDSKNPNDGEMEVFKKFHAYPATKMLTFQHRVEPFCIRAFYHEKTPIPHFEKNIGKFFVQATQPTEVEDSSKVKVKVKVRLDIHGCFAISSASMVETLPPKEIKESEKEEPMETGEEPSGEPSQKDEGVPPDTSGTTKENADEEMNKAPTEKTNKTPANGSGEKTNENKTEETKKQPEPKKQKTTKTTDLKVESEQSAPEMRSINTLIEIENELLTHIRYEKVLADAKNSVEEYVYDMRDKIFGLYEEYITDSDRDAFRSFLSSTEDWLYEESENQSKQVYIDKLDELKKFGEPIRDRYNAFQQLPTAFDEFGKSVTHYRKILDLYSKKDEKYIHIEEADMKKVHDKVTEKSEWHISKMQLFSNASRTSAPPVYPAQILTEKKVLEDFCNPLVNKPKPKVEPPPPPKEEPKKEDSKKEEPKDQEKMETEEKSANSGPSVDMELD